MDVRNQHHHIAALQRHWAALAARDAIYNKKRAEMERKAGNLTLARGYSQEARWDLWWRDRRLRIAKREGS
jgi:hypothetical protein